MKSYHISITAFKAFLSILCLSGCTSENQNLNQDEIKIGLSISGTDNTKSKDPGPDTVEDFNLFVVNSDGIIEEHRYIHGSNIITKNGKYFCSVRLLRNLKYSIYTFANIGYPIIGLKTLEELKEYRYYLTYPDEYSHGIPMCGKIENKLIKDFNKIEIELERVMAKISIRIDRSGLEKGTVFNVRSVQIGNCPMSVNMLNNSHARNNLDVFNMGFIKSYGDTDELNIDKSPGLSGEVSVYMLENMNGFLLPEAKKDTDKILDSKPIMAEICSYIELKVEYKSKSFASMPEEYLIYRFYLGAGKNNFDIARNCHYHFTVRPEGSGLNEDSWRVDKSGLGAIGKAKLTQYIE